MGPGQTAAKGSTWRVRRQALRHDREEYQRLRDELSRTLPLPPPGQRFRIHQFLEDLSAQPDLPGRISAVPVEVDEATWRALQAVLAADGEILPYAVLVHYRDEDEEEWEIRYDKQTRRVQRWAIILHEVIHWLLGHDCVELTGARLFPDIKQGFVQGALARTTFDRTEERVTEWLARWLLDVALSRAADPQRDTAVVESAAPAWPRLRLRWRVIWEQARRWVRLYVQYQRLRPLWKELDEALDGVTLDPPGSRAAELLTADGLQRRVERMALEIFDATRDLRRWMDARIGERAGRLARAAGMAEHQIAAVADGAVIAAAIQVRRHDPAATAEPVHLACAADVNVHAELMRLQLVAAAYTGPIVQATLADPAVQALLAEPSGLSVSQA